MKVKSLFIVLVIAFFSVNCSESCSENATPPQASVFIELVDATTNENLFTNLTYTEGDIVVKDVNDEDVDFSFVSKDELNTECYMQKKIIDVITPNYTTTEVNQIYRIKI
jgi:hypothetical protein